MAVSTAVRRYYATEIFAKTGRDRAPPNFVPLGIGIFGFAVLVLFTLRSARRTKRGW